MEDYYTIQTPGHHSSMFAVLHTLQKQGVMCDVILAAEDGEVMAHKVVLMAASKYFREKLSPVLTAAASKICLKGISVVELANLVKYIYTGKLLVAKDTMDITLEISEILELNGVIQGYKDIVSYEHLKGSTETDLSVKSQQTSDQSASGSSPTKKQLTDETNQGEVQTNLSSQNVSSSGSVNTPTGMDGVSSTSMMLQADLNQGVKATVTETSENVSAETGHGDGARETTEVSTSQYPSDYNFDTLFNQQYVDVSAGSRTPSRPSGINSPQAVITPPKLQQISALSTDSQKIAAERAQHQDLLAVAIETLSDVPHLKHQSPIPQPEVDRAVSSISSGMSVSLVPHNVFKPEEYGNLEDFENGKTSTKTVTLSAGSVSNELGGKTDVYTVALDPSTVKAPLIMARPKRLKSAKEKEAEEKAKMYRQKKAEIRQAGNLTDLQLPTDQDSNLGRGKRQKIATSKQDFEYESLSKSRTKAFVPRILVASKKVKETPVPEKYSENEIVDSEEVEDRQNLSADDFGQVVNFDSDDNVEDDVDGMIANNIIAALSGEKGDTEERANISKEIKTDGTTVKVTRTSETPTEQNLKSGKSYCSPDKTSKGYLDIEDKESSDDFQLLHLDEATQEKIRSSATKRKTRTPRKLPLSDEEKGNDSGPDRRENMPEVTTKRSRGLNLDRDKGPERNMNESNSEEGMCGSQETESKESTDSKDEDSSKPAEIKIIAQSIVDTKALVEAEKMVSESGAKKIMIIPRHLQPEVRLKKRTTDEMLQLAKDIAKSPRKQSSDKIDVEKETCVTEDDSDTEMIVDSDDSNLLMGTDASLKDASKRKNEKSENCSAVKKRKITGESISSPSYSEKDDALSDKQFQPSTSGSYTIQVERVRKGITESPETRGKARGNKKEYSRSKKEEGVKQTNEHVTGTDDVEEPLFSCQVVGCFFSSKKATSLRRHQAMFHDKRGQDGQTNSKGEKGKKVVKGSLAKEDQLPGTPDVSIVKKEVPDETEDAINNVSSQSQSSAAETDSQPECLDCGKTYKNMKTLKKHVHYSHSDRKKLVCEQCDFTTPFESSMSTHIMLKHTLNKPMLKCKFCRYESPLVGNLRKHILGTHGLFIVTKQLRNLPQYKQYEEGTILTNDEQLFNPESMELPKLPKIPKKHYAKMKVETIENKDNESNKAARLSLNKLPVEDFLKEMMKRHEEYLKLPEREHNFMSSTIAKATEHPSFPQASPQVRNTRANKIYNMKKLKPFFNESPMESGAATYGLGNLHGIDHSHDSGGQSGIPQVASEVEVTHDYPPEVVLENVEGEAAPPSTVLTISEQRGDDGSEMIIINQSGKQTVVRSKDFYDTLAATGQDSSQTLGVISALLQAGEQIEIREQEEIVEIQNM